MTERLEHELIAHAATLRRLAVDLVGGSDADDLVQETALQALRAPRREGHSLTAFFATILRHLASKHQRGERRRRERELLAARPESLPPHDVALAHHETLRRLTEALVALPEPYRGALLSRYYEGLMPAAIAAQRGEPLATVKSHLQRGLAMLRERLDRHTDGGDWRGALTSAFGLGDAAKVGTGVAAATTGVILMGTGVKLAIGGAAALAAVAATLLIAPPAVMPVSSASASAPAGPGDAVIGEGTRASPGDHIDQADRIDATPPARPTSIAGIVTDDQGEPLAGVTVYGFTVEQGRVAADSDADGHFTLVRPVGRNLGAIGLTMSKAGFDHFTTPDPVAWGRADLQIVMLPSLQLVVHVVRDDDGSPVERFWAYACNDRERSGRLLGRAGDWHRSVGRHSDGLAVIKELQRGRALLRVEPDDGDLAASAFMPLTIGDTGSRQVEVRLPRSQRRLLRVLHVDGTPVSGSRVQLLDSCGRELRVNTPAHSLDEWGVQGEDDAMILLDLRLGSAGEAMLQDAVGRTLDLRVLGAHPPLLVRNVDVSVPDPLVVTVDDGARLTGTARPLELLRELRRQASLPEVGPQAATSELGFSRELGLHLYRGEGREREVFPARCVIPADDGSFAIDGVPPGTWRLQLLQHMVVAASNQVHVASAFPFDFATLTLHPGQTVNIEVDLAATAAGKLTCQVLRNGKPFAKQQLTLVYSHEPGAHDHACQGYTGVQTDDNGRFEWADRQGTFWVMQFQEPREKGFVNSLSAPEEVVLPAGGTASATFHLDTGTLRCTLRDAAGNRTANIPLQLLDVKGRVRHELPETNKEGRAEHEVNAESFQVTVLPRRILDPDVQQEIVRQHPRATDPLSAFRIRLGEVTVKQGEIAEVELRLPPDWDR